MGIKTVGKQEKGQNLVEFALILPLFLLLVVGMAEFGRAWMLKNILTGAAREAVRAIAVDWKANACTNAELIANPILDSAGIPDLVCLRDIIISPPAAPVPIVSVTTRYNYLPITGFIPGLASFELKGTATMRRERD